jgi:hypothetical protein
MKDFSLVDDWLDPLEYKQEGLLDGVALLIGLLKLDTVNMSVAVQNVNSS